MRSKLFLLGTWWKKRCPLPSSLQSACTQQGWERGGELLHHKYQFAANFQLPGIAEAFFVLHMMVPVASMVCCEKEFVGRPEFLAEGAAALPTSFSPNSC